MMAQNFTDRIELSFWNAVIFLLSNSKTAQKIYRYLYQRKLADTKIFLIPIVIFAWAGVGLLAGFVVGRMGITLW